VIIALLGARSSSARSADLATIRNWVNGDETPVAVPRLYYASTHSHHGHPVVVSQPHRVKVRFASTGPSHRHTTRRVIASRAGA
jgi:D-alanyl-D-alanine endopeptidase (penicillin-binding protein 7)